MIQFHIPKPCGNSRRPKWIEDNMITMSRIAVCYLCMWISFFNPDFEKGLAEWTAFYCSIVYRKCQSFETAVSSLKLMC